ncbi:MAG: methyl-accepting chemotaxis protein [Lachnospiraceae bacterium]
MARDTAREIERKDSELMRINQGLIRGWTTIATVLFFAYLLEFVKGARTLPYTIIFSLILLVPLVAAHVLYRKDRENPILRMLGATAYTFLYVFVLLTGSTVLVFVYILPMLIVFMCFNDTKLISRVGAVMILVNLISVAYAALTKPNFKANLADYEIQLAAIVLCAIFANISIKISSGIFQMRNDKIMENEKRQATIIEQVGEVSAVVKGDTDKISESMDNLKSASDKTYGAMEEIVGGMQNATEMIEVQLNKTSEIQNSIQTADRLTEQIRSMVEQTTDRVGNGKQNMKKLMNSAADVEEGSKKVSENMELLQGMATEMKEIINIISNIAGKTNMLALNASIEAARAGDAGRGFAVVADQITQLANQTKSATDNIATMVNALSEKAAEAGRVVETVNELNKEQNSVIYETEQMFTDIDTSIATVNESVLAQTDCMAELVASNTEIVESIHTLSAISQEIMAGSQQTQQIAKDNVEIVESIDELSKGLAGKTEDLQTYVNK